MLYLVQKGFSAIRGIYAKNNRFILSVETFMRVYMYVHIRVNIHLTLLVALQTPAL